jgi:hypothetical protein
LLSQVSTVHANPSSQVFCLYWQVHPLSEETHFAFSQALLGLHFAHLSLGGGGGGGGGGVDGWQAGELIGVWEHTPLNGSQESKVHLSPSSQDLVETRLQ